MTVRRWLLRLVAIAALAALAFVGVTIVALEAGEVAVLETRRADGSVRRTHVWFAAQDGELWIEAGAPENAWLVDVQQSPELAFTAGSPAAHDGRYLARVDRSEHAHPRLRAALRAKYGWRDAWVGIGVDSSRSLAVRLTPVGS